MRKLLNYIIVFLIFLLPLGQVSAQDTCFIQLDNFTGFELIQSEFDELNQAACELVDSLPQQFQDSFKVYDFGLYLHNENMVGGADSVLNEVISIVVSESKYYMLFFREAGGDIALRLNLPSTDVFSCLSLESYEFLKSSIDLSLRGVEEDYTDLKETYLSSIGILQNEVVKLKQCCVVNLKKSSTMCAVCPDDIQAFRNHLERNGFIGTDVEIKSVNHNSSTNGSVESLSDITVIVEGKELDLNSDVANYINSIATKVTGIEARIGHYDPLESSCIDIMEWITEIDLHTLHITKKDHEESIVNNDYLLRMEFITTTDILGNSQIHMRIGEEMNNLLNCSLPDCEYGTIYLINIDANEVEIDEVMNQINNFFIILIGNKTPIVTEVSYVDHTTLYDLDAISIFGVERCEIAKFIEKKYEEINYWNLLDACRSENFIEKSQARGPKLLSLTGIDDLKIHWSNVVNKHGLNKSLAFLIFHALTHNCGLTHKLSVSGTHAFYKNEEYFSYGLDLDDYIIKQGDNAFNELVEEGRNIKPASGYHTNCRECTLSDHVKKRFINE